MPTTTSPQAVPLPAGWYPSRTRARTEFNRRTDEWIFSPVSARILA
jgi:hypothetical protein